MGLEWVIGLVLGVGALVAALLRIVTKSKKSEGAAEVRVEAQQQIDAATIKEANASLNEVEAANEVRDRLESDPDYARSVRDRFTRD